MDETNKWSWMYCWKNHNNWIMLLSQSSHLGHLQLTQSCAASRGDAPFPVSDGSFGKVTGNSSSGTATGPQDPQCTTGMGVPQYRCLDISQSLSLELVRWPPTFCSLAFWVMESKASALLRPENYRKNRTLMIVSVLWIIDGVVSVNNNGADLIRVNQRLIPVLVTFQHRRPLKIQLCGHREILLTTVWDTWHRAEKPQTWTPRNTQMTDPMRRYEILIILCGADTQCITTFQNVEKLHNEISGFDLLHTFSLGHVFYKTVLRVLVHVLFLCYKLCVIVTPTLTQLWYTHTYMHHLQLTNHSV